MAIATTTSINVKPRAALAGLRRLLPQPCLVYVLDQLLVIRTSSCPPSGEPTRTLLFRHYIAKGDRIARIGVDKRSSGHRPVSRETVKDVRRARTIKQKSRSPKAPAIQTNLPLCGLFTS